MITVTYLPSGERGPFRDAATLKSAAKDVKELRNDRLQKKTD